jgi:CBS domain-containing protein
MKKREPVSHIMTKNVHTVNCCNDSLFDAKQLMEKYNIRHVPVVSGEKLTGIISLTDIQRISFGSDLGGNQTQVDQAMIEILSIDQVMKHEPRTVTSQTPIKEVAEQLAVEEFHALPVVNEANELEGIVTTTDMVKYLIEQY